MTFTCRNFVLRHTKSAVLHCLLHAWLDACVCVWVRSRLTCNVDKKEKQQQKVRRVEHCVDKPLSWVCVWLIKILCFISMDLCVCFGKISRERMWEAKHACIIHVNTFILSLSVHTHTLCYYCTQAQFNPDKNVTHTKTQAHACIHTFLIPKYMNKSNGIHH